MTLAVFIQMNFDFVPSGHSRKCCEDVAFTAVLSLIYWAYLSAELLSSMNELLWNTEKWPIRFWGCF